MCLLSRLSQSRDAAPAASDLRFMLLHSRSGAVQPTETEPSRQSVPRWPGAPGASDVEPARASGTTRPERKADVRPAHLCLPFRSFNHAPPSLILHVVDARCVGPNTPCSRGKPMRRASTQIVKESVAPCPAERFRFPSKR